MRTIFSIYLLCLILAGNSATAQNQKREVWTEEHESYIRTKRSHVIIGIRSGYSHLLAGTGDGLREVMAAGATQASAENYYEKLKKGVHFSADAHYMISNFAGAGVKYSLFSSAGDLDLAVNATPSTVSIFQPLYYCIGYDERIYVNFVAPSFIFRQKFGKVFCISEKIATGYASYRSEVRAKSDLLPLQRYPNMLAKGGNIGINSEVVFEVFPAKWLSVGLSAGYFNFTVRKIKYLAQNPGSTDLNIIETEQKLEKDRYENLSRLDLSLGLNFHF